MYRGIFQLAYHALLFGRETGMTEQVFRYREWKRRYNIVAPHRLATAVVFDHRPGAPIVLADAHHSAAVTDCSPQLRRYRGRKLVITAADMEILSHYLCIEHHGQ